MIEPTNDDLRLARKLSQKLRGEWLAHADGWQHGNVTLVIATAIAEAYSKGYADGHKECMRFRLMDAAEYRRALARKGGGT